MDIKQFKENLLLYGTNVHQWPKHVRNAGLEALKQSSDVQELLAEHEAFEKVLRTRKYEEPSTNLAQRIISASLRVEKKVPFSLDVFLSEIFAGFRLSKPSFVVLSILLISVLLIGFSIGFLNPGGSTLAEQEQPDLQEFLYYTGDIL